MNRIEREKLVVRQMIAIYCHKHHAHNDNISLVSLKKC